MSIRDWFVRVVLLAVGAGMLITGVSMLRSARVELRTRVDGEGLGRQEGSRIHHHRMRETERMLRGNDIFEVSLGK